MFLFILVYCTFTLHVVAYLSGVVYQLFLVNLKLIANYLAQVSLLDYTLFLIPTPNQCRLFGF